MSPLDSMQIMNFKIIRNRGIFTSTYSMYFERSNEFILNAEKQISQTPYIHVSMIEKEFNKERGFVCKIRGDYNGLKYTFYSPGLNNKEVKSRSPSPILGKMIKKQDLNEMREEYGAIQ